MPYVVSIVENLGKRAVDLIVTLMYGFYKSWCTGLFNVISDPLKDSQTIEQIE